MMRRLLVLTAGAVLPALAGCGTQPSGGDANQAAPVPANVAEPAPAVLPTVEQPLTRRDLILAAMEAASDLIAGVDDGSRQQQLDGRSFSFRIRLCEGAPSRSRLTFDPDERVLRASVTPDLDAEDPVANAIGASRFEAVEGFWVPHPWLLRAACPPAPPAETEDEEAVSPTREVESPRPTLGLAQFFAPDTDRSARREGRPFTVTRRLDEGSPPESVDLVLRGRLTRLPEGKVINCIATAPLLPPQCIISVRFDSVRLEQSENGELLGEWSGA